MQQRTSHGHHVGQGLKIHIDESEPLRIDVFTSEYCAFCNDAVEAAKSAAGRLAYLSNSVEVRETPVDDNPNLIEELNIIALPIIQVGRARVIGLPSPEDIERLVHETILMG
jgi:hypothetical protein